jgi:hypothetical protein
MSDDLATNQITSNQTRQNDSEGLSAATREWKRRWRDPITLFTLLLVIVGGLQYCTLEKTDETLKVQQRAWLASAGTNLFSSPNFPPVQNDMAINFAINFVNTGREPATGINIRIKNFTVEGSSAKNMDIAELAVPKNDSCEGVVPQIGRIVIPPTNNGTVALLRDSIHGEPYFVADEKIVSGSRFYGFIGCAAYLTQGGKHYSSFCYVLISQPNQSVAGGRAFQFAPCIGGFDLT